MAVSQAAPSAQYGAPPPPPSGGPRAPAGSTYQLASDGFDGRAYSGVIRSDGRWVPCAADNQDWEDYQTWLAADPVNNKPSPWLSLDNGGTQIVLQQDEVPVGSMFDSLPPPEETSAQSEAAGPPMPGAPMPPPPAPASTTVTRQTTTTAHRSPADDKKD